VHGDGLDQTGEWEWISLSRLGSLLDRSPALPGDQLSNALSKLQLHRGYFEYLNPSSSLHNVFSSPSFPRGDELPDFQY